MKEALLWFTTSFLVWVGYRCMAKIDHSVQHHGLSITKLH